MRADSVPRRCAEAGTNRKFFWDTYLKTNTHVSKYIHSPPRSLQLFSSSDTHTQQQELLRVTRHIFLNISMQEWFLTRKKNPVVLATAEFEYKGEGCRGKQQKAASGSHG